MMLAEILPKHPNVPFALVNRVLTKKDVTNVIDVVYRHCGQKETVIFCDRMMQLGFGQACRVSWDVFHWPSYKRGIQHRED